MCVLYHGFMAQKARKIRRKSRGVATDKSEIVSDLPAVCANETLAVEFVEAQRWGDCPCCPRCGDTNVRKMLAADGTRNKRFLWKCGGCKRQYTVRINSVYEDSRIPMRFWVFAFWSACTHKKGVSALQIKRQTGLNYRSALFLLNRIRHAMTPTPDSTPPLGGTLEADEVYIGGAPRADESAREKWSNKVPVLAVVQRGGEIRTRPVTSVNAENVREFIHKNVAQDSLLVTDALALYRGAARGLATHRVIRHDFGKYVDRRNPIVHTNTVEGYFSLFRKRIDGTHHAVSPEHLFRYCDEAAFIYSTRDIDDGARTVLAIKGASNKRLTYKDSVLCRESA